MKKKLCYDVIWGSTTQCALGLLIIKEYGSGEEDLRRSKLFLNVRSLFNCHNARARVRPLEAWIFKLIAVRWSRGGNPIAKTTRRTIECSDGGSRSCQLCSCCFVSSIIAAWLITSTQRFNSRGNSAPASRRNKRWFFKLLKCYWNVNRRLTIKRCFQSCFKHISSGLERSHALLEWNGKQDSLFILRSDFFKLRAAHTPPKS